MNGSKRKNSRPFFTRNLCALFVLLFLCSVPSPAFAEEASSDDPTAKLDVPCLIVVDESDPSIVLYEKNADQRCIPGSTMKIMTCILSLELCTDLDQKVTVTAQAAALKDSNSLMGVIKGEELTVRQLLYGLMLKSGNDAALLLAQTLGGDITHFVELMNAKAAELGMDHTNFINASGAYKRDQYSTARDMAILTCYAMKNELFREIVSTVRYTIDPNDVRDRAMNMINSNKLISDPSDSRLFYAFATGVKTGSTVRGGKCLVAAAGKDGANVVAVLLGVTEGGSKIDRMSTVYEDAITLLDLALTEQFVSVSPADLGLDGERSLPISGAETTTFALRPQFTTDFVMLSRQHAEQIKADPDLVEFVPDASMFSAPIHEGDSCAKAVYRFNGRDLFSADLIAVSSVAQASSNLCVSTVDTPPPVVTEETKSSFLSSLPSWVLFASVAIVLGVVAAVVLLAVRQKKR